MSINLKLQTDISSAQHFKPNIILLSVWIFEMKLDAYYFGCGFLDCCLHLDRGELKHNVLAAVSSSLPQVYLVYLGIEMIQPGKSFSKYEC